MRSAALEEQIDELEGVQQQALGQRDTIIDYTDDVLALLAEVRLAAEQLVQTRERALGRLATIPGFSAELPEDAPTYADLHLSKTATSLLAAFNEHKLADLHAGLDAADGAVRRYVERVKSSYAYTYEPIAWVPVSPAIRLVEGECTCAMSESSMWACAVHGENGVGQ